MAAASAASSQPASEFPSIAEFYSGRSVLVTGATGFIGKVVVYKLLQMAPDLRTVYLLVRPKKDLSAHDRVSMLTESDVFSRVKKEQPNFADKIVPLPGELVKENLGLSAADMESVINNVSVVIHVAATIKFNEKLKAAVDLNVIAARRIVELARKLKNCRSLVHTSTAYAHTDRDLIEEVIYPPSYDPQRLVDLTRLLDDDMAETVTPTLLGKRPNTYTFTKSIAESIVAKEGQGLPLAIVRPSIVSASWREPYPGWVDNFNGTVGLSLAVGTGVLRVLPGAKNARCDIVPVDFVANVLVAAAWQMGVQSEYTSPQDRECHVINCTSGNMAPCKWQQWVDAIHHTFAKYPLEKNVFRRPSFSLYPANSLRLKMWQFLGHTVPGQVADFLTKLQGKKPHLMRTYAKLAMVADSYVFFTTSQWKWDSNNVGSLAAMMNPADRRACWVDLSNLHWNSYIESQTIGVKKYLMREDMSRLSVARSKQRKLALVSILLKTGLFAALMRVFLPYLRRRGFHRSFLWLLLPAWFFTRQLQL
eukprot:m.190660 g.190660  ORF g.190660 m.190660 type:complete len:534 (+) comp18238_c0_seq3:853-2454(+)